MKRPSTILIVDDSEDNLFVLEEILSEKHHVVAVQSGEACLDITLDLRPDLILLDVMMPGMDGYETCRKLRENPAMRHTKVIMVSAKALVADRIVGYEAGADDYITKPFNNAELVAKVEVYLRLKSVEEVDQLKTDVLTLLSHETRTPLSGILAPAETLSTEETMTDEDRKMLGSTIHNSGLRLLDFLERVIQLSAMKCRRWEFKRAKTRLRIMVAESIREVAALADGQSIRMLEEHQIDPEIFVDPSQVTRALSAMLDYAVRFATAESTVTIRTTLDSRDVLLSITNEGGEMSDQNLACIFDELATDDIDHYTSGTSLNLAIARQVILAHSSMLSARRLTEGGIAITLRFPEGAVCKALPDMAPNGTHPVERS